MTLGKIISTFEIKTKLRHLDQHIPNCDSLVQEYGKYLAERLDFTIVLENFEMIATIALYELQEGVDEAGKPIRNCLVGQPPRTYALLCMSTPKIAKAVYPRDFAKDVIRKYYEVNAIMR